jgi:hypothetical protein
MRFHFEILQVHFDEWKGQDEGRDDNSVLGTAISTHLDDQTGPSNTHKLAIISCIWYLLKRCAELTSIVLLSLSFGR